MIMPSSFISEQIFAIGHDDIEGLVGRLRQQLLELFPTLYESEVAVQCSLSNAYVNF